jgi:general secretion pathway protein E
MIENYSKQEQKQIRLAEKFGMLVEYDLNKYSFIKKKKSIVSYIFAKKNNLLPVEQTEDSVVVAISDPLSISSIDELKMILSKKIKTIFCPNSILKNYLELCYHQKEGKTKKLFKQLDKKTISKKIDDDEGYDLLESKDDSGVIGILNAILIEAIQKKASDIHFDPQEAKLSLRYRIDGTLIDRSSPPNSYVEQILTRIKVLAKLDIAEKRLPQDGRIKLKLAERIIDFRVSTIPTIYGERIVLRILDRGNILLGLDKIGMDEDLLNTFKDLIHLSEGIVLVTGPTGSGKTTTLYSALSDINSSEKNVMTIEDPVEYKLPNISQIGVNSKIGLTFSKGLRHILRQDPDIIMIGEIRDMETAQIAIASSLTGHLVFSTLHTNDAPSALTRLVDMGIEPYLLSSSIVAVVAQRLVRKICPFCMESYVPETAELLKLKMTKDQLENGVLHRAKGCDKCYNTGYIGRCALYQIMKVTPKIKKQIMKNVDIEDIKQIGHSEGMLDLLYSGVLLIKKGVTTSSEVLRVVNTL